MSQILSFYFSHIYTSPQDLAQELGDALVGKELAVQARGPGFGFPAPMEKPSEVLCICNPSIGDGKRQEGP